MKGSTAGRPIPPMTEADEKRFWAKVQLPNENDCMVWTAATDSTGYGQFGLGGSKYQAHRIAWTLANGSIPPGMVLDHVVCRNKACVNPAHLRVCTVRDNNLAPDGSIAALAAKNRAKTHCPQGHRYDDENTLVYRGRRYCRACHRERSRARRVSLSSPVSTPST